MLCDGIEYEVIRSQRKSIGLKIRQGKLYIYCSRFVSISEIEKVIREKKSWIINHLYEVRKNAKPDFRQGSEIYFLGKKYRLTMIFRKEKAVQFTDNDLYLCGSSVEVISKMYNDYCVEQLNRIIEQFIKQDRSGLGNYTVFYRKYKSKWGCCNTRKEITFNIYAISLPLETIRYLFYHELTHLKVHNHQKQFYDLLTKLYPDYKTQRNILKDYSIE